MPQRKSYSDLPEKWWAQWFDSHGLPAPRTEYQFSPEFRYRLDLAWPGPRLGVEIHGGTYSRGWSGHTSPTGRHRDMAKVREAQLCGWMIMEVLPEHVKNGELANLVERALTFLAQREKGWNAKAETENP